VEANEVGIGPQFVEKLEAKEPGVLDIMNSAVRERSGSLSKTFSRLSGVVVATASDLSTAVADTANEVAGSLGLAGNEANSLVTALNGRQVKHLDASMSAIAFIQSNQKVGELEKLLREQKVHSVPVWNGQVYEGVVDTVDLITWAVNKFSKNQLDAFSTFRQEQEFILQRVGDLMDASWRNHFVVTTAETELLTVLKGFRDRPLHRVFIVPTKESVKELSGIVTQTDILRFLASTEFASKKVRVGELIRAKTVIS
jgi:CBS-domain-containing membrane protein